MTNVPSDDSGPSDPPPELHSCEPAVDLPGVVFMVPNRHWGFKSISADDHPGVCLEYLEEENLGLLLQGTDANHITSHSEYYFVEPTTENGLTKKTAFRLVVRFFRWHRLRLYFPERYMGRLDEQTLLALRKEIAQLYPEE